MCQTWSETPKTGFLVSWLSSLCTGHGSVGHIFSFVKLKKKKKKKKKKKEKVR